MGSLLPIISVVIPCYNYGGYLANAIKSVLIQQDDAFHLDIVVIDDGSTDNTAEVARGFGAPVRYFYQENGGLPTARNTGLRHASGDYVLFLDADDVLGPRSLKSQLANFAAHPDLDVSVCLCVCPGPAGPSIWALKSAHLDMHICHSNISPVHTFLMRTDKAREVGLFKPDLKACEDYDFWLRCMANGCSFAANENAFVVYNIHSGSLTTQWTQQCLHDWAVRSSISNMLETIPSFPRAGKYYGWLACAAGSIASAYGLHEISPQLGRKAVDESARQILKAAETAPKTGSDDRHLLNAERYFTARYMEAARSLGPECGPGVNKAMGFLSNRHPNLAAMPQDRLNARSKFLFNQLCCSDRSIQEDLKGFIKIE